jgi:signal transduction histidine kinase
VVIDPASAHVGNPLPPPVHVEVVLADGRAVPLVADARLPAGTKRIEIEYTALSLAAPDKVRFRHRLSGFDKQWIDAGTRRRISYTNLPPGDYRFEVVASNNDGVWNEQGDRWTFGIAPHFHQTKWFYGAIAVLVVGAGSGLHVLRVRDLRLRNAVLAERTHLSQEIHDHISQIMTGVVLQLDAASQTLAQGSDTCAAHIDRASRLARQGIEETRVILRSLRKGAAPTPPVDTALDEALVESVAPLIEGTSVRLRARRRGVPFAIAPDAKHAIFHVGQEAVTNALRHGHARQVDIVVDFELQGVRLTIQDDGRGFEVGAVERGSSPGLGLAGMADRVARRDGRFDVRSRPGGGTMVTAFFPRDARLAEA